MPTFDNVNYTTDGGYADLDFAALSGVYLTPTNGGGFRIGQIGKRRVFVDRFGKVMILRGLYQIDGDVHILGGTVTGGQKGRDQQSTVVSKYGSRDAWLKATCLRMRSIHFNYAGENSTLLYNFPFVIPVVGQYLPILYSNDPSQTSGKGILTEPVKNIIGGRGGSNNQPGTGGQNACVDSIVNNFTHSFSLDVFDPKWETFANSKNGYLPFGPDSKLIYVQGDDADHTPFNSAGMPNEVGASVDSSGSPGFHGGMVALFGRLTITSQVSFRSGDLTTFTDTLNHTKRALLDYLKTKYPTIAALNTAWGTGGYYTSFETDGGWGVGTGLADEDGARLRAWFGYKSPTDPNHLHDQNSNNNYADSTSWGGMDGNAGPPYAAQLVTSSYVQPGSVVGAQVTAIKEDLDKFLEMYYDKQLGVASQAMQSKWAGSIYVGEAGFGGRGAMPRAPVIVAMGRWLQAAHLGLQFKGGVDAQTNLNFFFDNAGSSNIALIDNSLYAPSTDDSELYYLNVGSNGGPTQAVRGASMATWINATMAQVYNKTGLRPYVGTLFWDYLNLIAEQLGWGIISLNDNLFDGRDYRTSMADPYNDVMGTNVNTFTEDRVYTDGLTPFKTAFANMYATLLDQLGNIAPTASFTYTQVAGTTTINFLSTSAGNPTSFAWSGPEGFSSTQQNPTYTFSTVGTKSVTLTVTNTVGSNPVTQDVVVAQPVATLTPVRYKFRDVSTLLTGTVAITPDAITAGNLVVATFLDHSIDPAAPGITIADSLHNVWTACSASSKYGRSFYTVATVGGNTPVITFTIQGTVSTDWTVLFVREFSISPSTATIVLDDQKKAVGAASSTGPINPGTGTVAANNGTVIVTWERGGVTGGPSTQPTGWTSVDTQNGVGMMERDNVAAGSYTYSATFNGSQEWVSELLAFRSVLPVISNTTLTATTKSIGFTNYSVGLNIAGTTTLTASSKAIGVTNYPATFLVQTVTFTSLFPIRVLDFEAGQKALIVVRATVAFANQAYYANPKLSSLHPLSTLLEIQALKAGQIVEKLVALPNPQAILTYAQLQTAAQAVQTAFQAQITAANYGTMTGVDGNSTTFDGTNWS